MNLVRKSDDFAVHLEQLEVGDYVIDGGILVERKMYADFAISLVDEKGLSPYLQERVLAEATSL